MVVAERPRYTVPTANVFRLETASVPEARDGQILVRTTWLGLDTHLYRRVKRFSSLEPVPIGGVMEGATTGRVEVSNHPGFVAGDLVHGYWGWQDYHVSDGSGVSKIDPEIPRPSYVLGAFGISGFGAYVALNELVKVEAGETLTFGSALGGFGQMVGQLGKMKGARIVSGASGPEKCRYAIEQLGYDVCIDRKAKDFEAQIKAAFAKTGVHCYVMAAGGRAFELTLPYLHRNARIAIAGIMTFYAVAQLPPGPDMTMVVFNEINLRGLQVRGLVTEDWLGTPLHEKFKKEMKAWILGGKVKPVEHIVEGLENAPDMMQGLFEGRNFGKAVVRVAD
ncbi:MAG: zinc-binding dehydrogenase [Gammaproteobacteria bacterium]